MASRIRAAEERVANPRDNLGAVNGISNSY
jgi:hypothetical protein